MSPQEQLEVHLALLQLEAASCAARHALEKASKEVARCLRGLDVLLRRYPLGATVASSASVGDPDPGQIPLFDQQTGRPLTEDGFLMPYGAGKDSHGPHA